LITNPNVIGTVFKLLAYLCKHSTANTTIVFEREKSNSSFVAQFLGCKKSLKAHTVEKLQFVSSLIPKRILKRAVDHEKLEFFQKHPEILERVGGGVLRYAVTKFEAFPTRMIRFVMIKLAGKLFMHMEPDMIRKLVTPTQLSAFLVEAISHKDAMCLPNVLGIIQDLHSKLSDFVSDAFMREGVTSEVSKLVN
jgi:hypothetical protein